MKNMKEEEEEQLT